MIINIVSRRDFADALDYGGRVGKWAKPEGPALEIGGSLPLDTPLETYAAEFQRVADLRPEIRQNVVHVIIAFAEQDRPLTPPELGEIGKDVAEKLGYDSCLVRWTEHEDGHTQHLHGIVSAITFEGDRVDRTGDRRKAQKIRRDLERQWGLWRTPTKKGDPVLPPLPRPGEAPIPAPPPPAAPGWHHQVADLVHQVLRPGITLPQLHDELAALGVRLEPKWTKAMDKITGLGFRYNGKFEIASQVDRSFSLSGLQKLGLSYDATRDVPLMSVRGTDVPTKQPDSLPLPPPAAPLARVLPPPPALPPPPRFAEVPRYERTQVPIRQSFLQTARELACRIWRAVRPVPAPAPSHPSLPPR